MKFNPTPLEEQRILTLPKWAQDLISRTRRVIAERENTIKELSTNEHSGRVAIYKTLRDNVNLPDNSEIIFNLKDSLMAARDDKTYKEQNRFTAKIIKDVLTGGEMLEIYSSGQMLVETHASNVMYVRPRNVIEPRFKGFAENFDKE